MYTVKNITIKLFLLIIFVTCIIEIGSATYYFDPSWSQVADTLNYQNIRPLVVYNDGTGDAIYGGTSFVSGSGGELFKYNASLGGWLQVADTLDTQNTINSLVVYNDGTGNAIYGGTGVGGRLFKYNTSLGGWSQVAAQFNGQTNIYSLTTYDDGTGNAIYGGTYSSGSLFKYNTSLGGWKNVSDLLNSQVYIWSLITYNDGTGNAIYGGTGASTAGGRLFKYNTSLGGWSQVANSFSTQTNIRALTIYNDGTGDAIYGGTGTTVTGGKLLKYNTSLGGWSQVADTLNSQANIYSLITYNDGTGDAIYGGTASSGRLFKYNTSLGGWSQVAPTFEMQSTIYSLTTYDDGSGNAIYGGTSNTSITVGLLFKFNTLTAYPIIANFTKNTSSGAAPLAVAFTNTSIGNATNWSWFFGDENYTNPWIQQDADANWTSRYFHSSVVLPNGNIVLTGGTIGTADYNDTWRSTDSGKTWHQINTSSGWVARYGHTTVALSDGSIILMGGYNTAITSLLNDVWKSNDEGFSWTQINTSAGWTARYLHSSVVLPNNNIVVMGGWDGSNNKNDTWKSTDNGYIWTQVNSSSGWAGRYAHSSVTLPNGNIIVMGGWNGAALTNDVWKSTDSGSTWTQINSSAGWTARYRQSSVTLPNGSILLMGGVTSGYVNDAWLSPNGSIWTQINSSNAWSSRGDFSSGVLINGSIILMGGSSGAGSLNDTWIMSPQGSIEKNPTHTFSSGNHSVVLKVHNAGKFSNVSTETHFIQSGSAPVASFTQNISTGTAPATVLFTDTSTNAPSSWLWEFGDGNTSTSQNPTYTYPSVGNYTVTLTATNGFGSNSSMKVNIFTATTTHYVPLINSHYEYGTGITTVTTGWGWVGDNEKYGVSIIKTSAVDSSIVSFDGNYSHSGGKSLKINRSISAIGNYTLVSYNGYGTFNSHRIIVETGHTYNLSYWGKALNRDAATWVRLATGTATGSTYDYPCNVNIPSGTSDWTFYSTNSCTIPATNTTGDIQIIPFGSGDVWIDDIVLSDPVPVASFTQDVYSGAKSLTVDFTDTTTGSPTSWDWDWGDGTTHGTTQNPSHIYTTSGVYNVTLTATNAMGDGIMVDSGGVVVGDMPNNNVDSNAKKLYLPVNGTEGSKIFFDYSPSNNTVINAGGATINTTFKKFGDASLQFYGTSTFGLYIPHNASLAFGSNNFYIGWWENVISKNDDTFMSNTKQSNNSEWRSSYYLGYQWDNYMYEYISSGITGSWNIISDGDHGSITNNQWIYYTIVRNGTELQLWKDGLLTNKSTSALSIADPGTAITIGNYQSGTELTGFIDDVVIYNGVALNGSIIPDVELISNPTASFTKNSSGGIGTSFAIEFTNTSVGNQNVSTYIWNFTNVTGNNTPVTFSTDASLIYTFGPGNWSVTLTNINQFGTSTTVGQFINITNVQAPIVSFTLNTDMIRFSNLVTATDTSENTPTEWNWSFGDGLYSTEQNPIHQYTKRGMFNITLNATNAGGSNLSLPYQVRVFGYENYY